MNTLATDKFNRVFAIFSPTHKKERHSALFAPYVDWADAGSPSSKVVSVGF
jgi:hypothetical protein